MKVGGGVEKRGMSGKGTYNVINATNHPFGSSVLLGSLRERETEDETMSVGKRI